MSLMHGFVDASIRRRYLLCCITVHPRDLDASRSELRSMLLPGQRRLHFVHEASHRRKMLLSRMSRMNVRAAIYDCSGTGDEARRAGLRHLVGDLIAADGRRLVIESRQGRNSYDRQVIREVLVAARALNQLDYEHMRPSEEPLLWIADAVAWAAGADATWRRRVHGIVGPVTRIEP